MAKFRGRDRRIPKSSLGASLAYRVTKKVEDKTNS